MCRDNESFYRSVFQLNALQITRYIKGGNEYFVKEKEDEIPQRYIGCKPEDLRISDPPSPDHYGEFFIGPHGPLLRMARRPLEGKAERSECRGNRGREPRALPRDRYCLDLVTVVAGVLSPWGLAMTKNSGPLLTVRLSVIPIIIRRGTRRRRGDAIGRGSRCTGATDRFSLLPSPSLGKAFSSFMASSSSTSSPSSRSPLSLLCNFFSVLFP